MPKTDHTKQKLLTGCIFIVYIIAVLCLTFVVRETMDLRTTENRGVILQPFRQVEAMLHQPNHFFWLMQIVLNVALFIPFGFLLPFITKLFRNPILTTAFGAVCSGAIETMQYITGRGLTEIDDVITNTTGALFGVVLYWLWVFIRAKLSPQDPDRS